MAEDTASKMIIDNPLEHVGMVWESREKPSNPITIEGKARTVSKKNEPLDIKNHLDEIKVANSAFEVGAGYGYTLADGVLNTNQDELRDIADAYLQAETGIVDHTPLGRSEWVIKNQAMYQVDGYYDKRTDNYPLRRSYYKQKEKYLKKAYKNWNPKTSGTNGFEKPSRGEFDKLSRKLVYVRDLISGKTTPVPTEEFKAKGAKVEESFQDGFKRAFNFVADPLQTNSEAINEFRTKYWYLK